MDQMVEQKRREQREKGYGDGDLIKARRKLQKANGH